MTLESLAAAAPKHVDPYQRYRKSLLSPQRVRQLSELRPWRPVVDTLLCWCGIGAAWMMVAAWPCWWTILLAIPVIGVRYYALMIVGHDAIHRRLFRALRLNDAFADLFIFGPIFAITRINNRNHLGHHHHLSTANDPDLHQFTCANKYKWPLLLLHLTGLTSVFGSLRNVFIRGANPSPPAPEPEPLKPAASGSHYSARDFALIGLWQFVLVGGLTVFIGWWAYPLLWMAPLYLFAFVGDNLRAFAEHSQPRPDSDADARRLITFLSNPIERVFIAPLNMNYHAVHHLWPSIPYYNLAVADREIRDLPAADGLEWRGTYLGYVLRYFSLLPLDDCRPGPRPTPSSIP